MSDVSGKKISELRVVDLRLELDKRGLDRNGVKGVLVERLTQALQAEGINPDNFVMEKEADKTEISSNAPKTQGELTSESTTNVTVKVEPPLVDLEEEEEEGENEKCDLNEGGDVKSNEAEETNTNEVDDQGAEVDAEGDAGITKTNGVEGTSEGEAPVDEEVCDGDNTMKDENGEVDNEEEGAGEDEEQIYEEGGEEQEEQYEEEAGEGEEEEQEVEGEDGSYEKGDEEQETVENVNESHEEVLDDELDQDALHLTIGEDEEEDKNYILDEERDRDKTEDEKEEKPTDDLKLATSSGVQDEPVDKGQQKTKAGIVKVKPVTKKETKGTKSQSTTPGKESKPTEQAAKASSSRAKEAKTSAASAKKRDTKTGAEEPAKTGTSTSEKAVESHSSAKVKPKNPKEKDITKKDVKGPSKDVKTDASKRFDSRRMHPRHRPPRPYEKPVRIPMNRPKRRSMSPRMRRPNTPMHRQTLSFEQIREMRERERQREREREMHRRMRERERREREEVARQREIERRNAEQMELLERERQRLRIEREKVEREKEDLIRMERERQRAERERIEREKEEIRRAKLDDRSRRSQKRPYDEEREREENREFIDRKKLVTNETRRHERPYAEQLQHSTGSSRSSNVTPTVAVDRRESETVRHDRERGRHHRSDSRGFSPTRETVQVRVPPRPPIIHDRGTTGRDWRYSEELHRDSRHREKDLGKEKRTDDRRDMRIARERELPAVTPATQRGRGQTEYSASTRNDPAQHHRSNMSPMVKARGADRYDIGKSELNYAVGRDETWMRRATYDTPSAIPVAASQISTALPGRDKWMPERQLEWSVNDRISVRPSVDIPDRWISGSGSTLNSAVRGSGMTTGHIAQLVPAPQAIYNQHAAMALPGGNISSQPYSSDRYSAYGKQAMHMRRY